MQPADPTLVDAITDHLAHGRAPEDIKADVVAAGYTEAEWQAAYQAVQGESPIPPPVPPLPPPAATAPARPATIMVQSPVPTAGAVTTESAPSHTLAIVVVTLSILTAVAIGLYLFLAPPAWFSALQTGQGGRLPIPPSEEFVPLMVQSLTAVETAKLAGTLNLTMAPREPGVRAFDANAAEFDESERAMMQAFAPQDINLDATLTGYYDVSELLSPDTEGSVRVDLSVTMPEMLPQRVVLDADGKVVSEAGVFVRLNELELPAIVAMFFDDSEYRRLIGQWLQVVTAQELSLTEELPSFQRDLVAQITSRAGEIVFEEVANHEFITVTAAESAVVNGVRGARYTHEFNHEVLPTLLRRINERFNQEFGAEFVPANNLELERFLSELDTEALAYAREHVVYTITLSDEGKLLQYEAIGKIAPDDAVYAGKQFNTLFRLELSEHNQPIVVTAPLEYMTKAEMEDALGITAARESGVRATIQQGLMNGRSQAELYYNGNGYSYSGLCGDARFNQVIRPLDNSVDCLARTDAYRVYANLPGDTTWWCIDSTGFSSEISTQLTATQYSCTAPTSLLDSWQRISSLPATIWSGALTLANQAGQVAGVSTSVPSRAVPAQE